MSTELIIGDTVIKPGTRQRINLDVANLYDFTEMTLPIEVIRGKKEGPCLFISGAIHGDEINGVDIVRRILTHKSINRIKGTLIAVPIVNVYGFNNKSRYLPDRRDLNRNFPGSQDGSMTAQLAYTFINEIVNKCTHGIDLHTAANNRANLPQIRAAFDNNDEETLKMAHAFPAPVLLNSTLRPGSIREYATQKNIPILLFEGGEALKFNDKVIKCGYNGVIAVMREIGMLPALKKKPKERDVFVARSSYWMRASQSGILSLKYKLGERVKKDQALGFISDQFGKNRQEILARRTGIVIGITNLPLVNRGDAIIHIATYEDSSAVEEYVDSFDDLFRGNDGNRFLD